MKRIITIISAAVLGMSLSAQPATVRTVATKAVSDHTEFGNITVNDAELSRNSGVMTVNMDLDLSQFEVGTNRAILLTPYIVRGEEYHALPSLGVYGRNR